MNPPDKPFKRSEWPTEPPKFVEMAPRATPEAIARVPGGWQARRPFIYHPDSHTVYIGPPGRHHSTIFEAFPQLYEATYPETYEGIEMSPYRDPEEGSSYPASVTFFNQPPNYHIIKHISDYTGYPFESDDDAWHLAGSSSFPGIRFVEHAPRATLQQIRDDEAKYGEESWLKRRPFVYDPDTETVIIGAPGTHHGDIWQEKNGPPYAGQGIEWQKVPDDGRPEEHSFVEWHQRPEDAADVLRAISEHTGFPPLEPSEWRLGKQAGVPEYAEHVPIEAIMPYKEYDRRPGASTGGISSTPEYWDALKKHIAEHGFEDPLTLEYEPDTNTARLGEGNHRLLIAQELGLSHVPVHVMKTSTPGDVALQTQRQIEPDQFDYFPSAIRPHELGLPISDEPYVPAPTREPTSWYPTMYPNRYRLTTIQKAAAWDKSEIEMTPVERAYILNPSEELVDEEQQKRIREWRIKAITPNFDQLHGASVFEFASELDVPEVSAKRKAEQEPHLESSATHPQPEEPISDDQDKDEKQNRKNVHDHTIARYLGELVKFAASWDPSGYDFAQYQDNKYCNEMAEWLHKEHPELAVEGGYYNHPTRGPGDHVWNVAPDGTIVDTTAAQHRTWREGTEPARDDIDESWAPARRKKEINRGYVGPHMPEVIPPGHPHYERYVGFGGPNAEKAFAWDHENGLHGADPTSYPMCPVCRAKTGGIHQAFRGKGGTADNWEQMAHEQLLNSISNAGWKLQPEHYDHPMVQMAQRRLDALAAREDTPFDEGKVIPADLREKHDPHPQGQDNSAVYMEGTHTSPVILFDPLAHNPDNLLTHPHTTIDHEVAHAIQDERAMREGQNPAAYRPIEQREREEDEAENWHFADSWVPKDQWPAHNDLVRDNTAHCTCKDGHKLDCPVHGLDAVRPAYEHVWDLSDHVSPAGKDADTPRTWMKAQSGWQSVSRETLPQQLLNWQHYKSYGERRVDPEKRSSIVHKFPDNWTVQAHPDPSMTRAVGMHLRNCWQGVQFTSASKQPHALHDENDLPRAAFNLTNPQLAYGRGPKQLMITEGFGPRNKRITQQERERLQEFADANGYLVDNFGYQGEQNPEPTSIVAAIEHQITWEPGQEGKWALHNNGAVAMWPTDKNGLPGHYEVTHHKEVAYYGEVDPEGNLYGSSWWNPADDPETAKEVGLTYDKGAPDQKALEQVAAAHPALKITPHSWGFRAKVAKETLPQQVRRWKDLKPHPRGSRSTVVHQYPDGWTVQEHPTKFAVQAVGQMMQNCWQGKAPQLDEQGNLVSMGRPGIDAIQHFMAMHDENDIPRVAFYVNEFPSKVYVKGQGFQPGEYGNGEKKIRSPWGPRNQRISDGEAERLRAYAREHGISDRFQIPEELAPEEPVPATIGEPEAIGAQAKVAADEFDTRQYPDARQLPPTNMLTPAQGRPHPEKPGCTCGEGLKLECPIHGMFAIAPDKDHTWSIPEGHPVGYPQDQPRNYKTAESAQKPIRRVDVNQSGMNQQQGHPYHAVVYSPRLRTLFVGPAGGYHQEVYKAVPELEQDTQPEIDYQHGRGIWMPKTNEIDWMQIADENDAQEIHRLMGTKEALPETWDGMGQKRAARAQVIYDDKWEPPEAWRSSLPVIYHPETHAVYVGPYGANHAELHRSSGLPEDAKLDYGDIFNGRYEHFQGPHGTIVADALKMPWHNSPEGWNFASVRKAFNAIEWFINRTFGPIPSQEELDRMIREEFPTRPKDDPMNSRDEHEFHEDKRPDIAQTGVSAS